MASGLVLGACQRAVGQKQALPLEPCRLSSGNGLARMAALCGRLLVPEKRESEGSRQISLHVAVIPARTPEPEADPLFFLAGGPGQAASSAYLEVAGAFQFVDDRDVVLVDQRGTGRSHPLKCKLPPQNKSFKQLNEDALRSWVEDCVSNVDADLSLYSTEDAILDLDAVRRALGYQTINLYGASYGTRVALRYLGRYERHVRTVILDGVLGVDVALGADAFHNAEAAVRHRLLRCESDAGCGRAFPKILERFEHLLARVARLGPTVKLKHPVSHRPVERGLTIDSFWATVRLLVYQTETAALLPLLVHDADVHGDFSNWMAQSLLMEANLEGGLSHAMHLSVICAEDVPFFPAEPEGDGHPKYGPGKRGAFEAGLEERAALARVCARWPRRPLPEDARVPVQSEVPALVLSGEVDPVTPPAGGTRVTQSLKNSMHVVAQGQGHIVGHRGCIPRLISDFLKHMQPERLHSGCALEMAPMPFFLNFLGPSP